MEVDKIWQEQHKIDASMVDATQRATLVSICNFLQVVAGNHASYRGIGFDTMTTNNRFWALNRMVVQMKKYPLWRSTISIHTWVHRMKGPFSYRNFDLFGSDGMHLGSASTLWVAVDAGSRKPVRIEVGDFPILSDKIPDCGEPGKVSIPNIEAIGSIEQKVRYSDLDMVHHVNNVKYIEWISDSYGIENREKSPTLLEVNFLNETLAQNAIRLDTFQQREEEFYHEIKHKNSELTAVKARVCF